MPGLICLREKLWTRTYSIGDQVPTCPVFTRAKIKVPFWDFSQFAVTHCYVNLSTNFREPPVRVEMSPFFIKTHVEEILLPGYLNLSTDYRKSTFRVDISHFLSKHIYVLSVFTYIPMLPVTCSRLWSRDSTWARVFTRKVMSSA